MLIYFLRNININFINPTKFKFIKYYENDIKI